MVKGERILTRPHKSRFVLQMPVNRSQLVECIVNVLVIAFSTHMLQELCGIIFERVEALFQRRPIISRAIFLAVESRHVSGSLSTVCCRVVYLWIKHSSNL